MKNKETGGNLSKRVNISISDELHERIQMAKKGFSEDFKLSQICQKAIEKVLDKKEAFEIYRKTGIQDGKDSALKLDQTVTAKIINTMKNNKKLFEKVSSLEFDFKNTDYENFYPKFVSLMAGDLILHDWVEHGSAEDRRGDATWYYMAGWYEGVATAVDS